MKGPFGDALYFVDLLQAGKTPRTESPALTIEQGSSHVYVPVEQLASSALLLDFPGRPGGLVQFTFDAGGSNPRTCRRRLVESHLLLRPTDTDACSQIFALGGLYESVEWRFISNTTAQSQNGAAAAASQLENKLSALTELDKEAKDTRADLETAEKNWLDVVKAGKPETAAEQFEKLVEARRAAQKAQTELETGLGNLGNAATEAQRYLTASPATTFDAAQDRGSLSLRPAATSQVYAVAPNSCGTGLSPTMVESCKIAKDELNKQLRSGTSFLFAANRWRLAVVPKEATQQLRELLNSYNHAASALRAVEVAAQSNMSQVRTEIDQEANLNVVNTNGSLDLSAPVVIFGASSEDAELEEIEIPANGRIDPESLPEDWKWVVGTHENEVRGWSIEAGPIDLPSEITASHIPEFKSRLQLDTMSGTLPTAGNKGLSTVMRRKTQAKQDAAKKLHEALHHLQLQLESELARRELERFRAGKMLYPEPVLRRVVDGTDEEEIRLVALKRTAVAGEVSANLGSTTHISTRDLATGHLTVFGLPQGRATLTVGSRTCTAKVSEEGAITFLAEPGLDSQTHNPSVCPSLFRMGPHASADLSVPAYGTTLNTRLELDEVQRRSDASVRSASRSSMSRFLVSSHDAPLTAVRYRIGRGKWHTLGDGIFGSTRETFPENFTLARYLATYGYPTFDEMVELFLEQIDEELNEEFLILLIDSSTATEIGGVGKAKLRTAVDSCRSQSFATEVVQRIGKTDPEDTTCQIDDETIVVNAAVYTALATLEADTTPYIDALRSGLAKRQAFERIKERWAHDLATYGYILQTDAIAKAWPELTEEQQKMLLHTDGESLGLLDAWVEGRATEPLLVHATSFDGSGRPVDQEWRFPQIQHLDEDQEWCESASLPLPSYLICVDARQNEMDVVYQGLVERFGRRSEYDSLALPSNTPLLVVTRHRDDHTIAVIASGDPGLTDRTDLDEFNSHQNAGGPSNSGEPTFTVTAGGAAPDKALTTRRWLAPRRIGNGSRAFTIDVKNLGSDNKAHGNVRLEVPLYRRYFGALRLGVAASALPYRWTIDDGGAGQSRLRRKPGDIRGDLLVGYTQFFERGGRVYLDNARRRRFSSRLGGYVGLGLLGIGPDNVTFFSSLQLGADIETGKNTSLTLAVGMARAKNVRSGFTNGTATAGGEISDFVEDGWAPVASFVVNLTPDFFRFASRQSGSRIPFVDAEQPEQSSGTENTDAEDDADSEDGED